MSYDIRTFNNLHEAIFIDIKLLHKDIKTLYKNALEYSDNIDKLREYIHNIEPILESCIKMLSNINEIILKKSKKSIKKSQELIINYKPIMVGGTITLRDIQAEYIRYNLFIKKFTTFMINSNQDNLRHIIYDEDTPVKSVNILYNYIINLHGLLTDIKNSLHLLRMKLGTYQLSLIAPKVIEGVSKRFSTLPIEKQKELINSINKIVNKKGSPAKITRRT